MSESPNQPDIALSAKTTGWLIHAELTKLNNLPEGILDPNGAATGGVIHEGYSVKGYYTEGPKIGQPFTIFRYERNGVEVAGVMKTSPVVSINALANIIQFNTQNSVYQLNLLPDTIS